MFGLDDTIAHFSDGTTVLVVLVVAVLLGLRHAADPDHLAAVTTLLASGPGRGARRAGALGMAWGLGHATSLFAFGVPVVLYQTYLPPRVQQGAEAAVGIVIVALATWLLVRWRRGAFVVHAHDGVRHAHEQGVEHPDRGRAPGRAYGIGVLHGMGGTAGVGVLLLGTIGSHALAIVALALFALFTAVSMALVSSGFGVTLEAERVRRAFGAVAPVLGAVSFAFGVWYALGALELAPYWL